MDARTNPCGSAPAISARAIGKRFGRIEALSDLSLELHRGEALGLVGTNGAGKTTALEILQGLRRADTGKADIFGSPAGSIAARRHIGVTPQNADFPEQMSPREVLTYAAAHFDRPQKVSDLVATFGLGRLIDRRMGGFSGGETRRLALALAFVGNPALVFADEPTAGLDTDGQEMFKAQARAYVEAGGSLLLTSHHWDEIEQVCDRIVMIDRGRVVLQGTLEDIRRRAGHCRISFDLPEGATPSGRAADARYYDGRWQIVSADSDALVRELIAAEPRVANLHVIPLDLKDTIARLHREETGR
ncbi:MAG: ABC transporter ATP-binding protein [Roseitalea porphyridii]|uniref:ABC transporter ATP-binding protein n=1 Tax=Roseitalea porphyridii TaxID=1852022 RepID=UPI0032D971CD